MQKNKRWLTNTKIFKVKQKNGDWGSGLEMDTYLRTLSIYIKKWQNPKEIVQIPTKAREVYDVSGAGDTSLAVLGAAIGAGAPVKDAIKLDAKYDEITDYTYSIERDSKNNEIVIKRSDNHRHLACGVGSCTHIANKHSTQLPYKPLTDDYVNYKGLPTSGNYYLMKDISVTKDIEVKGDVNLCSI